MKTRFYILDKSGNPIPVGDVLTWGHWFETSGEQRVVARTKIGNLEVSTVFLSLDHNLFGDGPPILWETMVFDLGTGTCIEASGDDPTSVWDELQDRCSGSREQAEAMHEEIVRKIKGRKK